LTVSDNLCICETEQDFVYSPDNQGKAAEGDGPTGGGGARRGLDK